ncbi:hypothetical protein PsYK624_036060 [Phanerochaete sordida]|uniref:F-box domain-containing protein n=1 Tax=Phanerochaete sordida TaxID=48140 RepID=A0A9P3LB10_9APHY|nr:hypothetical protein PsYK624_036060 [Phanerochaete sordida]
MTSRPAARVSASIKSLPAEVLAEVFVLSCAVHAEFNDWCEVNIPVVEYTGIRTAVETLAWEDEGGSAEEPLLPQATHPEPYACLPLSLVCRHWRAVVLECGALWCNIIITSGSLSWTTTLLSRSKEHPVNVACKFSLNQHICVHQVDACTIALKQLHRVRSLRLSSSAPFETKSDLASILTSASYAPSLQNLHIFHHLHTLGIARTWTCPRLKTYEGHCGKGLPWTRPPPFPVQSSLTRFVWRPTTYINGTKPASHELYAVLRQLPVLEHLQVDLSRRYSHQTPGTSLTDLVTDAKRIHLPRLRRVILDGSIQPCSEILDIIDFPAEVAHVTVSSPSSIGYVGYAGPSIWSSVPTFESDRHRGQYLPPPRGYGTEPFAVMEFTLVDDCDNAVICGWRDLVPTTFPGSQDVEDDHRQLQEQAASYGRGVELYVPTSFFETYMRQLLAPFSMSHVQILCLREPWVAWDEQWTTMLPMPFCELRQTRKEP